MLEVVPVELLQMDPMVREEVVAALGLPPEEVLEAVVPCTVGSTYCTTKRKKMTGKKKATKTSMTI